ESDQIIGGESGEAEGAQLADEVGGDAMDAERGVAIQALAVAERLHVADESDGHVVHGQREEIVVIVDVAGDAESAEAGDVTSVRREGEAPHAVAAGVGAAEVNGAGVADYVAAYRG